MRGGSNSLSGALRPPRAELQLPSGAGQPAKFEAGQSPFGIRRGRLQPPASGQAAATAAAGGFTQVRVGRELLLIEVGGSGGKSAKKRQEASEQACEQRSRKPSKQPNREGPRENHLMIVNSQPYSPTRQQLRCTSLAGDTKQQEPEEKQQPLTMFGGQQQNSLYAGHQHPARASGDSPDLLDLAHLQHAAGGPFEAPANGSQQHQHQQHQFAGRPQQRHQDLSLYSPSSSTSLLYHIYDQINVPGELHAKPQEPQQQHRKLNSTTTILNPANLFGGQQQQQQALKLPMSSIYQQQQQQQQQPPQPCYGSSTQYLVSGQQQPLFATTNGLSHQQPAATMHHSQSSYQAGAALEAVLRQQATLARHQQPRPLSSSAASSNSGQSAGLAAYAAHRLPALHQHTLKAHHHHHHNQLPSLLHPHSHLHGAGATLHGQQSTLNAAGVGPGSGGSAQNSMRNSLNAKWRRCSSPLTHLLHQYRTPLRYSFLLILLAFCFVSIIKFTLMSAPSASNAAANPAQQVSSATASHHLFAAANPQPTASNTFYPQSPLAASPSAGGAALAKTAEQNSWLAADPADLEEQQRSKLVIGEFVVLNQNYSHSQMHRSFLGKQIVQLMDQVFLGSEMRRVYSKMEITDVRPARPTGIVVSCNIVLRESIPVAAQQFGVALYNSLTKSHERLANHNYIIDRSSIKFNTVPDKDLRAGLVPPALLSHFLSEGSQAEAPPGVAADLAATAGPLEGAASSELGPTSTTTELLEVPSSGDQPAQDANAQLDPQEAVVWSEWSPWSSCVDKNGLCDSGRLHSRLRRCINQTSAQLLEAALCKQRFNSDDRNIEVEDCSRTCDTQAAASQPSAGAALAGSELSAGPQTAPPLFGPSALEGPASFFRLPAALTSTEAASKLIGNQTDLLVVSTQPSPPSDELGAGSSTASSLASSLRPIQLAANQQQQLQQVTEHLSCSNCTSDEICLLLVQQKVPFCAKIKDRADESGCGGWCRAPGHLCQPVGQNAFKCVHDSECLAEEWRCHDSACIPSTNRCDGHPNCFDSSDELDCPAAA